MKDEHKVLLGGALALGVLWLRARSARGSVSDGKVIAMRGDRGDVVEEIQSRLNGLGFDAGSEDGIFGPRTEAAVKSFQGRAGLTADGVVGEDTMDALKAGAVRSA